LDAVARRLQEKGKLEKKKCHEGKEGGEGAALEDFEKEGKGPTVTVYSTKTWVGRPPGEGGTRKLG